MRIKRTLIFTVFLFCLDLKGAPAQESASPSLLRKDKAAQKALKKVVLLMDRKPDPRNPNPEPGWYDKRVAHQLKNLMESYPGTYSALTAKLRLTAMLSNPENNFKEFDKTMRQRYLSELRDEYPETWQATFAEFCQVIPLIHQEKWRQVTLLTETILPKIDALEFEHLRREFPDFAILTSEKDEDDMRAGVRDLLVLGYCKLKRFNEAARVARFIIHNFPESKAAKDLHKSIKLIEKGESPYG